MPQRILIKLKTKHKERILKAAREKQQVTFKGNPICLTADLSAETFSQTYQEKEERRIKATKLEMKKERLQQTMQKCKGL